MPRFPLLPFQILPSAMYLALVSTTAMAADLRVSTGEDRFDGICNAHCSLRDAVAVANNRAGLDRILLSATYVLTRSAPNQNGSTMDEDRNRNGDLDIRDELIILGQGAERTEIKGAQGLGDRIFEVLPGASLTLERLKVSGGFTSFYGGGLENHGVARLNQVTFSDNQATSSNTDPGNGGAIANYGGLSIFASTFTRNSAYGGQREDRSGGAGHGGVLYNQGQLLVRDSLFNGNRANSLSDEGFGGVIYNAALADISRSSFIDNWAAPAGKASAIHNVGAGVLKVTNSTFSQNIMDGPSGVITNDVPNQAGTPSAQLINITIADNLGNGLYNGGALLIRNSIIAGNTDGWGDYADQCRNIGNAYRYKAVGLVLGTGAGSCTAELYIDNAQTLTRLLHPLSAFNERTLVHALRQTSVALDAGIGSCPQHDQRKRPRPRDGDGDGVAVCDLGAYERGSF